ncbi:hypothetical protein [Bacillus altitudinis]|uniref:hypothetical protein n=1 Tax=Bacillus altitudinis TaxID=293387 RepID=UPI001643E1A6|nr:hypothetical protein [Bacillus altitudinis]
MFGRGGRMSGGRMIKGGGVRLDVRRDNRGEKKMGSKKKIGVRTGGKGEGGGGGRGEVD